MRRQFKDQKGIVHLAAMLVILGLVAVSIALLSQPTVREFLRKQLVEKPESEQTLAPEEAKRPPLSEGFLESLSSLRKKEQAPPPEPQIVEPPAPAPAAGVPIFEPPPAPPSVSPLTVLEVDNLPAGIFGEYYEYTFTVSGGTPPYRIYSIVGLPSGLSAQGVTIKGTIYPNWGSVNNTIQLCISDSAGGSYCITTNLPI